MQHLRLGVNIDHVATIRNARGGVHPDPVKAAIVAAQAGADGITAHLREDRRHIRDQDIVRLMQESTLPLNFEMAATEEMLAIALRTKPHAVCIVPEKRQEVTTEGGLDVIAVRPALTEYIKPLKDAGIRVSLFIDPVLPQVEAAMQAGAQVVELHTGKYCEEYRDVASRQVQVAGIKQAAVYAVKVGLECHAGHGLSFESVSEIAAIDEIVELNIGHFIIGESVFMGLTDCIQQMRKLMQAARA